MADEGDVINRCHEQMQLLLRLHDPVPRLGSKEPALIRSYLYLGDFGDVTSLGLLSELGITHLLNCAGTISTSSSFRPPRGGSTSVRSYKQIDALDSEDYDLLSHFDEASQYIDEARSKGGKVLAYCARGINRSAALCVAYLVAREQVDLFEAVKDVALARGRVLTNPGFQRQLITFAAKYDRLSSANV